jgi:hypothetical protein
MRFSAYSVRLGSLLVGLSLVAVVGCGPSVAKISGKVTYKGDNLKGGTVSLIPVGEGQTYSTRINEDGTYSFDQILSGKYKVCVETMSLKAGGGAAAGPMYGGKAASSKGGIDKSKIKNEPPPGAQMPVEGYRVAEAFGGSADERAKRYVAIPPEFGNTDTTPLTVDVKGGTQTHDIPLS